MIKTIGPEIAAPQGKKQVENPPFSMVSGKNDRMAGSVPVWQDIKSFAENIAGNTGKEGDKSSFGFTDFIDIINPLQHIPLVSNFYQSTTGDTMGAIAQIVGGALFGGPVGAVASMASVAYHTAQTKADDAISPLSSLDGTTIALADLRAGYKPYNS